MFGKETFIKQLSAIKNYLYNLILKSLQVYYANSSSDSKLRNILAQIKILYEKALYPQCIKLLAKAKKIGYKYENHLQILEIIDRERQLRLLGFHIEKIDKKSEKIFAEEKQILEAYKNISEYNLLTSKIFSLINKNQLVREKYDLEKLEQITDHPLLGSEDKALSKQAKSYYYLIHGTLSRLKGDNINNYKYTKKRIGLMESNSEQITKNLQGYIAALNNFAIASTMLKKYDETLYTIKKLKTIPQTPPLFSPNKGGIRGVFETIRVRIFIYAYSNELDLYLETKYFEKGIALVNEIEQGLKRFSTKIPKVYQILFYYNIARLYFGVSNYSEALEWMNKILNDTQVNIKPDIHCCARILNLIIHYELGNYDLVEYRSKSTHYFLDKRKRLYKVETAFLNFFQKKLPKVIGQKELVAAFKDFKKELEEIFKDPFERKALEYFDFISWVDSKISYQLSVFNNSSHHPILSV